jgi:hypothetical protein
VIGSRRPPTSTAYVLGLNGCNSANEPLNYLAGIDFMGILFNRSSSKEANMLALTRLMLNKSSLAASMAFLNDLYSLFFGKLC